MYSGSTPSGEELNGRVVANIERLRKDAGMTTTQVIEESGLNRSRFYARIRNETPWTLEDLSRVAAVFDIEPATLALPPDALETSDYVLIGGAVLGRRLSLLQAAADAPADPDELLTLLRREGVDLSASLWESLTSGSGRLRISRELLSQIAGFFGVESHFLTAPESDQKADRIEAQLELRAALRASGGGRLGMRALGDVPPSALRAIARSLLKPQDD